MDAIVYGVTISLGFATLENFEYVFFFNKNEKKVKGVIQFGSYTQGPPG